MSLSTHDSLSTSSRLPIELVASVISFASEIEDYEDRIETLQSCSLVCRAWLPIAQKISFAEFTYAISYHHNYPSQNPRSISGYSERRLTYLSTHPNLASLVSSLRLEAVRSQHHPKLHEDLIKTFPNVQRLEICLLHDQWDQIAAVRFVKAELSVILAALPSCWSLCIYLRPEIGVNDMHLATETSLRHVTIDVAQCISVLQALTRTNSATTLRNLALFPQSDIRPFDMFASSIASFVNLTDLDVGWFELDDADSIHLPKSIICNGSIKRISLAFRLRESTPDFAFALAVLFSQARLPSLQELTFTFEQLHTRRAPREPQRRHDVHPFGTVERKRLYPPYQRPPILTLEAGRTLQRLTLRFEAVMRVVVEHGASFLQLFGEAARPEVLHVEARGRPVDFEED